MFQRLIEGMRVGTADGPLITTGTFAHVQELIVPVMEVTKRKPSPAFAHQVAGVAEIRALVQRDVTGNKLKNAKGALPDYIRRHLRLNPLGYYEWTGPAWVFMIWLPEALKAINGQTGSLCTYQVDASNKGFPMDAESRTLALELMLSTEPDPAFRKALEELPVIIEIYDGLDWQKAAKHFRDVNSLGVGISASLMLGHDYDDPWMRVTRNVFEEIGIPLEMQNRQVRVNSPAILTVIAARTMVAAVAKGIGAVAFGSAAIPTVTATGEIDFDRLETAATTWLRHVFTALGAASFRDKDLVLRAAPVIAALGALGKPFYTGDLEGQIVAKATLAGVDWTADRRWAGIAGKVNANGGFSVSSGKESGHAVFRALTERGDQGYGAIRNRPTY